MQIHRMGSHSRAGCQGLRCSHLTEVKEAHTLQGQFSTGNPEALGSAAERVRACSWGCSKGAGALPRLSYSSSSPQPSCLSHQPNTAALPCSEEGRRIASMLTWDFSNISEFWFQFLFPFTSLEDKKLHRWCLLGLGWFRSQ